MRQRFCPVQVVRTFEKVHWPIRGRQKHDVMLSPLWRKSHESDESGGRFERRVGYLDALADHQMILRRLLRHWVLLWKG